MSIIFILQTMHMGKRKEDKGIFKNRVKGDTRGADGTHTDANPPRAQL